MERVADEGVRTILFNSIKAAHKECTQGALNKSYNQAIRHLRAEQPCEGQDVVPQGEEWREQLLPKVDRDGEFIEDTIASAAHNIALFLENHELLRGCVRLDRLRDRPRVMRELPWEPRDEDGEPTQPIPRDWTDADTSSLRVWFQRQEKTIIGKEEVWDGIAAYMQQYAFDPVKDYLNSLEWDGVKRLDTWLTTYCGAEDTPLNRTIGTKWMISAVARQRDPGCQAKYVLVLEGEQDAYKSEVFSILGGDYYTDDLRSFEDKDTATVVQTNWICELGELVLRVFGKHDNRVEGP